MADAVSHTTKPQTIPPPQIHANPTKFFLYKAAIVTLFLVLLPLFPSLAPEFINQTLHARSWEFLQLIFVGIAVSYGLFSKKNDETDKDQSNSKLDNAQSYVSKLLQVSSVFEDESENQALIDENKVQTWTSQYYREEPPVVVVVAKERETTTPVVKEDHFVAAQKPLLLPVRSLKHRLPDEDINQKPDLIDDKIGPSNSKRFNVDSTRPKIGEFGGVNSEKENVVLRSPIPWRSRSGRIEFNENGDGNKDNSSIDDRAELNRSFRSSKPNLSSFSSESQAKSRENVVRRKNLSSTPAPPPPPPPPPPLAFLRKSNSSVAKSSNGASSEKLLKRSFRSVPAEELSESEIEEPPRTRTNLQNNKWSQVRKSVGTFKSTDNYETNVVDKKAVIESSDDESSEEEEDDYFEDIISSDINGKSDVTIDNTNTNANANNNNSEVVGGGGPDVDKKADEFIAKFREQIRLQRIESIRRSTAQRAGKTTLR